MHLLSSRVPSGADRGIITKCGVKLPPESSPEVTVWSSEVTCLTCLANRKVGS